jgi:hypothetical protein
MGIRKEKPAQYGEGPLSPVGGAPITAGSLAPLL